MWSGLRISFVRTLFCVLLCFVCCAVSQDGYTQISTATMESITIPMSDWQTLTEECRALKKDLMVCKNELTRIRKPSAELLNELSEAETMLKKLSEDLEQSKTELIQLSNELTESKTSLEKLKKDIDKERRVYKRQLWQNRMWCLIIGAGIGYVASR